MFEVGFSEILLIAVVALLVVGPRELPTLVRNVGSWLGKARQFMNTVKTEFDREIHKADEIKRLMAKEVEIAEEHKRIDLQRRVAPASSVPSSPAQVAPAAMPAGEPVPPPVEVTSAASAVKQDHGAPQA